jgi:hypothetical protein
MCAWVLSSSLSYLLFKKKGKLTSISGLNVAYVLALRWEKKRSNFLILVNLISRELSMIVITISFKSHSHLCKKKITSVSLWHRDRLANNKIVNNMKREMFYILFLTHYHFYVIFTFLWRRLEEKKEVAEREREEEKESCRHQRASE